MSGRRAACVIFAWAWLVATGCGGVGRPPGDASQSASVAQAQAKHEYPSPAPPRETAAGGGSTAVVAIRAFANAYINWTAETVTGDMRWLAAHSIGQARSAMTLAAEHTANDYELSRAGIANSGTIEAISPLAGRLSQYVVVTRELTTATNTTAYQGLRPAWHVALATVVELSPDHWVVSRWQPES